jgi:hypothetical protein
MVVGTGGGYAASLLFSLLYTRRRAAVSTDPRDSAGLSSQPHIRVRGSIMRWRGGP